MSNSIKFVHGSNVEYRGFYIWRGYIDPMYCSDYAFEVSLYPSGYDENHNYTRAVLCTPNFTQYEEEEFDYETCIIVLERFIDECLCSDDAPDFSQGDYVTIVLGDEYFEEMRKKLKKNKK